MKLANVSGAPLTGAVVAEAKRLLQKGQKTSALPGGDGVLYMLIAHPQTGRVVIVNGLNFAIAAANGNSVYWQGGIPPFTVSVERGDLPATFANVDQDIYTVSERAFTVLTRHQKDLVDDDYDWWAANDDLVDGLAVQTSVGVIIEDSSEPPRRIFAPFGGMEGIYEHFGPETWCVPIIVWLVPNSGLYGSVAMTLAQVFVPGDDTTPLPGTFTYDPPLGTVLNAGTHTVSVTFQATDEIHYHEATEVRTVIVNKAAQVISAFRITGDGYFTSAQSIYAISSSGLPVTFTCYVVGVTIGSGTITFPEPGTYTVYATQAGDGNYEMATQREITYSVTSHMPQANMTVTRADSYTGTTTTYHDTTPAHPDGSVITITWALTRPAGSSATLASSGTFPAGTYNYLTPDIPGVYVVTLTATDEWGVHTSVSNTFTALAAAPLPQTISFILSPNPLHVGETGTIVLTNAGISSGTWSGASDDITIATVATGWHVYGVAPGSVVIEVLKTSTDPSYADALATNTLTVIAAASPLVIVVLNSTTIQISGGTPFAGPSYNFAVYPTGSTGGLSFSGGGSQTVVASGSGCYCAGSGIKVTDAVGASAFIAFGTGGYMTGTALCTSGCPSGSSDPDWEVVWETDNTAIGSTDGWADTSQYYVNNNCSALTDANWGQDTSEVLSVDGMYKAEYFYNLPTSRPYPGDYLAAMNAATGLSFTYNSFDWCGPNPDGATIAALAKFWTLWRRVT